MVTLAIHTYSRALLLKTILEIEGIDVSLQNVNLLQPVPGEGVRVRIREEDLPLALKIVENTNIPSGKPEEATNESNSASEIPVILVPVDFSPHSLAATKTAFQLASPLGAKVCVLNAYISPMIPVAMELNDELAFQDEVETATDSKAVAADAEKKMKVFAGQIRQAIDQGSMPAVRFSTENRQGAPEDVIETVSRQLKPILVVMGTRGCDADGRQVMGSVTAEVLDSARYPVLTVPDTDFRISNLKSVTLLAQMDQGDIPALDMLNSILPHASLCITIITLLGRKEPPRGAQEALLDYCHTHYPAWRFDIHDAPVREADDDFQQIQQIDNPDLILVPSKRKNVFARLFNPGIAHRLVFQAEVPMLAVPIY